MAEINNEDMGLSACVNNETRARNTIAGKQRNHGGFQLPASLVHLTDPPLYLAVAYWGLLTGGGFTREDVSQAFRISQRRAADVMSYISRERSDVITCERQLTREGRGRRSLALIITAVREPMPVMTPPPPRARKTPSPGAAEQVQRLRHWFLSRPNTPSAG